MPEIVVERDENGLPICKRCRIAIQDESQHEVYEDEVHAPGIFLGPYCQDCLPYIKTCSQCNHGFSLWEEAEKSDEITYVGEGLWLCHECKANLNFCNICDRRKEDCIPFDGFEKVCHDCRSLRTFSCAECDTLRLENNSVAHYVASDIQASYKHLFSTPLDLVCKDCWTQRTDGEEPADITLCECCDEFFPTRDPNEPRSNKYCDGCYTNRMIIECDWCEESVEHGNAYHIRDEWICHHCYENKFRCVSCNNIHDNRNMYTGTHKFNRQETGSKLCKGCGDSGKNMICPTCKSYTNNTEVFEGKRVCNICKHQLNMCPVCKEAHLGEVQCRKDIHEQNASTLVYNYTPFLIPRMTKKDVKSKEDTLFIGFENEQQYEDDMSRKQQALAKIYNYYKATEIFPKSDSSIRGYGFEVVSHPMTLSAFKRFKFAAMFEHKPEFSRSCGLHVHLSRTYFKSKLHLYKMTTFYNTWDTFVSDIVGRSFNNYCHQLRKKISYSIKNNESQGRHAVINLGRDDTVEVRICQGAISIYELRYRVEFVHAMATFSKGASLKASPKDFIKYVKQNRKMYKNIYKFLSEGK